MEEDLDSLITAEDGNTTSENNWNWENTVFLPPLPVETQPIPPSGVVASHPPPEFSTTAFTAIDVEIYVLAENFGDILCGYQDEVDNKRNTLLMRTKTFETFYVPTILCQEAKFIVAICAQQQAYIWNVVKEIEDGLKIGTSDYRRLVGDAVTKKKTPDYEMVYLMSQRTQGLRFNCNMSSTALDSFYSNVLHHAEVDGRRLAVECSRQLASLWPQTYQQFIDNEEVDPFANQKNPVDYQVESVEECCICKLAFADVIFKQDETKDHVHKKDSCRCKPRCCRECTLNDIWLSYQKCGRFKSKCPLCRKVTRIYEMVSVNQTIPTNKRKPALEIKTVKKTKTTEKNWITSFQEGNIVSVMQKKPRGHVPNQPIAPYQPTIPPGTFCTVKLLGHKNVDGSPVVSVVRLDQISLEQHIASPVNNYHPAYLFKIADSIDDLKRMWRPMEQLDIRIDVEVICKAEFATKLTYKIVSLNDRGSLVRGSFVWCKLARVGDPSHVREVATSLIREDFLVKVGSST